MDFTKIYTSSGGFNCEFLFAVFYSTVPSKYQYEITKSELRLDEAEITFEKVKDLFTQIDAVRKNSYISVEEGEKKEIENVRGGTVVIAADHKVVYIEYKSIIIYYDHNYDDTESVEKLAETIYNRFPVEEQETTLSKINLIKYYNGDYYTDSANIRKVDINIDECYNDDFIPVYNTVVDFLKQPESGIVIFHGAAGTGKSSILRHLCNTYEGRYVIVPNSVAYRLGDPDLIDFITNNKDSIFILEDCEQLLIDRSDNAFNSAISTILNMADGLLSDVVNIKLICTFNAAVENIDKALLRKGRCVAKYEFGKLTCDKVKFLNEKYELHLPEIKEMTLAEVFHAEKPDYTEVSKPKKIGF